MGLEENVLPYLSSHGLGSIGICTPRYNPYFIPTPYFHLSNQEEQLVLEFMQETSPEVEVLWIAYIYSQQRNPVT